MKKYAALGILMYFNPISSLRLAPAGLARRFAPGETILCSGGTRAPFARDDFFTNSREPLCRHAVAVNSRMSIFSSKLRNIAPCRLSIWADRFTHTRLPQTPRRQADYSAYRRKRPQSAVRRPD
ncbi:MAG: hypothetical protein ACREYE_01080 [Gammaproteobacteria bacterium]